MPVSNPQFTLSTNGVSTDWTLSPVSAALLWCDFAPGPSQPYEGFEAGWGNDADVFELTLAATVEAVFSYIGPEPQRVESFERGWFNDVYDFEFPSGQPADFEGHPVETFNAGWLNDTFKTAFVDGVDIEHAAFGTGRPVEDFAQGWVTGYVTDLVAPTAALFRGGVDAAETFGPVREARQVGVVGNFLTLVAHGMANGDRVRVVGIALAAPLDAATTYTVSSAAADKFRLAKLGVEVVLTSEGTPPMYVTGDPTTYWTSKLTSI